MGIDAIDGQTKERSIIDSYAVGSVGRPVKRFSGMSMLARIYPDVGLDGDDAVQTHQTTTLLL